MNIAIEAIAIVLLLAVIVKGIRLWWRVRQMRNFNRTILDFHQRTFRDMDAPPSHHSQN